MSTDNRPFVLIPLLSVLPVALGACLGTDDSTSDGNSPTGIRGDSDTGSSDTGGLNGGNRPDPDGETDAGGGGAGFDGGGFDDVGGGNTGTDAGGGGGDPSTGGLSDNFMATLEDVCNRAAQCDPEFYTDFADEADCVAQNAASLDGIETSDPSCADALQQFLDCIASERTCDEAALQAQCYDAYMSYYYACSAGGGGYGGYGGDYGGYGGYGGDYGDYGAGDGSGYGYGY